MDPRVTVGMPELRVLADLSAAETAALLDRNAGIESALDPAAEIVATVRETGDQALYEYAAEFDGVERATLSVGQSAADAYDRLSADIRDAIEAAVENVRRFHRRQRRSGWTMAVEGGELRRTFRPLRSVGVYVPGGTAAYPSSAIMGMVPAVVAGVDRIVAVTPPGEPISDVTLGAIHAAGADEVYAVGGAQAVGALAYGTETIDPVQKIVGPGNRWVSAAKAIVRGDVEIDFVAGPSEVLTIADETAPPELVAADLLAQAEHDPNASVVAVVTDRSTGDAVCEAIDAQRGNRSRREVIDAALENDASGVFLADSHDDAVAFANAYAAEHLSIMTAAPETTLDGIDAAGSVFLGPDTPVAAGDYASGTNHVLPTTGQAAVTGGLSVDEFVHSMTVQQLDRSGLAALRNTIEPLADAEGLDAHAASVRRRFE